MSKQESLFFRAKRSFENHPGFIFSSFFDQNFKDLGSIKEEIVIGWYFIEKFEQSPSVVITSKCFYYCFEGKIIKVNYRDISEIVFPREKSGSASNFFEIILYNGNRLKIFLPGKGPKKINHSFDFANFLDWAKNLLKE